MKITSLLALTAALAFAAPTIAETVTVESAGIQFDSPKDWKVKKEGESVTVDSADGGVSIVFQILPGKAQDAAVKAIEDSLDKAIGKVKWGEKATSKEKVNGMDAEIWNGTAKEGKLQVEAIYLESPADKTVGIYWFDTPESEAKNKADADSLWKSIKPLEKK